MYRIEISFDTELSNIITQFNSWRKNREKGEGLLAGFESEEILLFTKEKNNNR